MKVDRLTRWVASGGPVPGRCVALMYHAVTPGPTRPGWPWAVSHGDLKSHLDWIADQGYRTVTIGELARDQHIGSSPTVAITFDDGYADNLLAVDELRRRGMKATWFIVTGSIGASPAWQDTGRPAGRLLNGSELRAMHDAGMEIGSHGVRHRRVTDLELAELRSELRDSRSQLAALLGCGVASFAYPYGAWSAAAETEVRAAGYLTACTTRTGWATIDRNPMRIRRLTVFNHDHVSRLARKLALGSHDVSWPQMASYWARQARERLLQSR